MEPVLANNLITIVELIQFVKLAIILVKPVLLEMELRNVIAVQLQ